MHSSTRLTWRHGGLRIPLSVVNFCIYENTHYSFIHSFTRWCRWCPVLKSVDSESIKCHLHWLYCDPAQVHEAFLVLLLRDAHDNANYLYRVAQNSKPLSLIIIKSY